MLDVAHSERHHVWASVAGSTDDEEPGWQDFPQEEPN